jgi:hypothetical protein
LTGTEGSFALVTTAWASQRNLPLRRSPESPETSIVRAPRASAVAQAKVRSTTFAEAAVDESRDHAAAGTPATTRTPAAARRPAIAIPGRRRLVTSAPSC